MDRRHTILALAALGAAPLTSLAQPQGKVWRVGMIAVRSRPTPSNPDPVLDAFVQGMRDLGYLEGKNLILEWRSYEGQTERAPGLAAELVQVKPDVIVTIGTSVTLAAQKTTTTIPIVMIGVADPVGDGVVKSLARPGGNTTGVANLVGDTTSKAFEVLLVAVPKLSRVAALANPTNESHAAVLKTLQAAAQQRGVTILPVQARTAPEIEIAFSTMTGQNAKAVIVLLEPFFQLQRNQIVELAARHGLPSIAMYDEYALAGGLMGYGANRAEYHRRAATYVDKILKGAKPGDLPIEQPTNFDFVINLKTAKALRVSIPQSLLLRANRVIE